MNRKKIFIAVLNQNSMRVELAAILNEINKQGKYDLIIEYPSEKPISNNRNKIVQSFLQSDCDYLLMIDNDIVPPLDIINLADFQKDVISPVCFMYQKHLIVPLILRRAKDGQYSPLDYKGHEGLVEVDAVGTGCIFISRRVLEKIRAPFLNEYDLDGIKKIGLDLAFCRKAKAEGFKIFCHLDYVCEHWVTMDLKNIYVSLEKYVSEIKKLKMSLDSRDQLP